MSKKLYKSHWFIFAVGMLLGMLVLAACAAATQTVETPAETEEAAATEDVAEEPAAETDEPAEVPATEAVEEEPEQQEPSGENLLQTVMDRGTLRCGVNAGQPGFGSIAADGTNAGFDVDFCRAVAAAVLGDANAVEFITLTADQRLPALQTGEIDLLIRNTTWTLTRDADLGLDFTVTNFYDGQGFVVRADEFASIEDLAGGTVCVTSGTTTEANLADLSDNRGLGLDIQVFAENPEAFGAFEQGACDAYTGDKSGLAGFVASAADPDAYAILAETISKEPLGPVVRANDSDWRDVVMWTVFATFEAEELGINQENVDSFLDNDDIRVQRLLGTGEDNLGSLLGLNQDFAYQIISQVGNYADIYDRHLTPIAINREGTLNALWTDGGAHYSPPWR